MHDAFMGHWRQALNAIVPGRVEIEAVDLGSKAYAAFVKDAPAFSDIQVYEIEALQSLCAWGLDAGCVSAVVDTMFGGTGRVWMHEAQRRQNSPIETGVRRRLFESLSTAYESVWQAIHPIRMNPLRQEALLSSLRLTAASDQVVHARFRVLLNDKHFSLDACMPLRALEILLPPADEVPVGRAESVAVDAAHAVPHRLQDAPVEVVAMLGELDLTVAQLMSLSIGQVVPFQMNEQVPLQVDGVRVVGGRSGVRNGRHAVKVELSEPVNLQGLKAEFVPLVDGLETLGPGDALSGEAPVQTPEPEVPPPSNSSGSEQNHEPDALQ